MAYEGLSKEELLAKISELEQELKASKKYGLVWDKEAVKEEVVQKCESDIPVLVMDDSKTVLNGGQNNILIEGDNFHSLTALNMIGNEVVDIIYIDPPYNTGNKDFLYNDNYVNNDDGFVHSKWLSFMEKRLKLSKNLLKPTGIVYISIDDNELASLKLLCDSIFGEANYVAILPRVTKKSGKDHSQGVAKNHDYVLIYTKNKNLAEFQGIESDSADYPLKDEFYETRGGYKLNQTLDYDSLWYNEKMDFCISIDGKDFYPGGDYNKHLERHNGKHKPKDWVWRWSADKFKYGYENGFVVIKEGKGRKRIYTKTYANASISNNKPYYIEYKERNTHLSSIALIDNAFSNDNAKKEITRIGFDNFGFPKPTSLIKQLIKIAKNSDVVLDFFAGSGTTGQAVMELNKEDEGNRRFILCTNNESNICSEITQPRLKTAITGQKSDGSKYSDGLEESLYYFKTDFIRDNKNTDQAKYSLVEKVDGLLCIKEDLFVNLGRTPYSSHYANLDGTRHMFIYNDYYNETRFNSFKEQIMSINGEKVVYVFSTNNQVDEALLDGVENAVIKPIPDKIYEIYKEIAEDIKRG